VSDTITYWQEILKIADWKISLKRIMPEQIDYDGEDYFIGISRDFDKKEAVIHHDIDLTEEAIVHELLHVAFPEKNEEWINETTDQYLHSKYKY
jgi:hypothetical protein|tara:strand:+ start:298 stop:579 length:282 start_codon:yes stop_codon:yes gene_type:complete